jgi:hypothetical protein
MNILNDYLLVEKLPKKEVEGFEVVETQDDFVYKGKVIMKDPKLIGIGVNDIILFAKDWKQ